MLKTRVIPVLFLMNGLIVRSENFSEFKVIGNPINQLERLNDWLADELIYIDITRSGNYDLRRDDMKLKGAKDVLGILRQISKTAFMPLTFGTLKAAFYAMLFALPLAILGAIYSAQFMHPSFRKWAKPSKPDFLKVYVF